MSAFAPLRIGPWSGGGGMRYGTESGATWASHVNLGEFTYTVTEVPWLGITEAAFLGLGQFRWHPTLNRIFIANPTADVWTLKVAKSWRAH